MTYPQAASWKKSSFSAVSSPIPTRMPGAWRGRCTAGGAAGELALVSLQAVPRFCAGQLAESFSQVLSIRLNEAPAVAWNDSG